MKIFHNPRCRKSRETLAILEDKGIKPEIVLYLKEPPGREELKSLLRKLDMQPSALIRKGEKIYKENYKGRSLTEEQWLEVLLEHPKLMERPIVVEGEKAVVGRPPENVRSLF